MLQVFQTSQYSFFLIFFFFNDTAPTEIYTLSLHDALPILDRVAQRERRESQVDRDAPPLLLLPTVGIDAGEGFHQGRLAVVDETGGPDYEAAEGIGMRGAGGGTHARRSQKSRAEREPASARG